MISDVIQKMNISFIAKEVEYTEALDGDIIQISFDEDPSGDPFNKTTSCIVIQQNYEFPNGLSFQWNDGNNNEGASDIFSYVITNEVLELKTTDGLYFKIKHNCKKETLKQIVEFLEREITSRENNV